jgi:autotransporter translocation and assembly factor TamB
MALAFGCLQFECSQKALIKILIKTFTPYKASALKITPAVTFPFQVDIKNITLVKNHKTIATLKNMRWEIKNLLLKDIFLNIDECDIITDSRPLNFDFSSLSPSGIGYLIQSTSNSLQRFSVIHLHQLQIDNKKLTLHLKREQQAYIVNFSNAVESLTLTLTPLTAHSKLHLEGTWEGYKMLADAKIYPDAIDFSVSANISNFANEHLTSFLGHDISLEGRLQKSPDWQLTPLKIETSRGHTLQGECTQQGNNLNGTFVWMMPMPNADKFAKCHMTIGGAAAHPTLKWEFKEGIIPLEKAVGECKIIDSNHIKISGQAFADAQNTASLEIGISLNPFLINGNSTVTIENLQKFFHSFWPNAKGNLNFNASLENVTSLEKGHIVINGQGIINDTNFHLPIDMAVDISNGLGQGKLHLTKGHYQHHPLDAHIDFKSTATELRVEKCTLQLQDLQLALVNPTTYHFQKGLIPTKMQFCAGTIEIEKGKLGDLTNITGVVNVRNVQVRHLKILFGDHDITGILNGNIQKLDQKPLTMKLELSKGYWKQQEKKQTYKVVSNLHAGLDAQFENTIWKWNLKVKDQDKINVETYGHANLENSTIDAHIKGLVRLKLLTDWIATDDRIFGDITFNIHAKGPMGSPVLEGTLNADNGLYEHSDVGTFYQNIIVRAKAQGRRLIITRFDAEDVTKSTDPEQGQLRGEGWIDFTEPFSPVFNVPMHLFHLRIAQNDGFISDASGTLTITGKGADVGCKGEVTLEKASYFIEQSADTKIPKIIDQSMKENKKKQTKQYATAFPLEILIHTPPGSFKVIGSGADSSWKGDFYVKKSIVNPFLVGTVYLHKGTLDILGKVLRITHGEITFVDTDRNNPRLDIRAVKRLDNATSVAVEIKGTGDKTIIDFTSIPSMPKEEILALLLFGKKLGEVSVLQSVQLAEIAKSNDSGGGFFEKMRSSFGFDQFEFKTSTRGGVSDTDEDATPEERAQGKTSQAVRIGKEFGKVQVAIEQGAGSETSKVVVSTPLGKNLALQGDVGAAQNSGVGISWIKRY